MVICRRLPVNITTVDLTSSITDIAASMAPARKDHD